MVQGCASRGAGGSCIIRPPKAKAKSKAKSKAKAKARARPPLARTETQPPSSSSTSTYNGFGCNVGSSARVMSFGELSKRSSNRGNGGAKKVVKKSGNIHGF